MNVMRNLMIAAVAAVLLVVLMAVVFMSEEARMDDETLAQQGESIARGALLYDSYCAGCHGQRGEGLAGIYPPLNVEDLWAGREAIAFYGTLHDYVALNISAGHPNQRMPSWADEYGGPLRNDQVEDLTNFVLNWQGPQPPGVRGEAVARPTPTGQATPAPAGPVEPGDPARGEQVFAQNCVACHGPDAAGSSLGPTLISADLAARDDNFFRETITQGRSGTSMPTWGPILGGQSIEDVIAFLRTLQ